MDQLGQSKSISTIASILEADTLIQSDNQAKILLVEDDLQVPDDVRNVIADAPWFPKKISDLDKNANRVLTYDAGLEPDHPGFKDDNYRQRRRVFEEIAFNYKHGQPIPKVEYTKEEIDTWCKIYDELKELHKKHACREYLENFNKIKECCGLTEQRPPQLEDVSRFLKEKTGFQLRPVAGFLSSRDFLAGLAFRVFQCTQYMRHSSKPFFTPEPDCCHELLGHVPLFADPDFADFSQEIGLASLGASDEDVNKLATIYFFTIEVGLCRQDGEVKVYGAALLSSVGEFKHVFEGNPKIAPFNPDLVAQQKCIITEYQETYFCAESFQEAQRQIKLFAKNMNKGFQVIYNQNTENAEILPCNNAGKTVG